MPTAAPRTGTPVGKPPARELAPLHRERSCDRPNVGTAERKVSGALGLALAAAGLNRRSKGGLVVAGIGGALLYRAVTGHCSLYSALGIKSSCNRGAEKQQVEVAVSYLVNKPAAEIYEYWRDFERLPEFMTHLQSVEVRDATHSHWTATAPWLYGSTVEWDAEIVADEKDRRIAWRSLPGSSIDHCGSIEFTKALGDRGTHVRVTLSYHPPAGQLGRWTAKLFGEEPEQQIRADLRNFKRLMEVGEIPTIEGQPRGTCR